MKMSVKRIYVPIGSVVLFLLFLPILLVNMKAEEKEKNETLETLEIVSHVYAINDSFVNMYVIQDGDSYVVVDAGNDANVIAKELKKLNINPDKVVAVLLTHTHFDHIGALTLFKNATVYLSNQEIPALKKDKSKLLTIGNKVYPNRYVLLNDQQVIQVKHTSIKGIQTPGHTMGSICYLVNNKYLFVGDSFSLNAGKIDKPNKDYTKDMAKAILSFKKISNLPTAKYIFTAHTGYSGDYKNAVSTELK